MSSPSSLVNTYLSSPRIANFTVSSTLISPLPPSFLDKYILATSLLEFNARCIVINFLVLLSICSNSAPVQSKNAAEYLSNKIAHVFIHLIIFSPFSFVSSIFFLCASFHLRALLATITLFQSFHCCFIRKRYSFTIGHLSFLHCQYCTFFHSKFHPYVITKHAHSLA